MKELDELNSQISDLESRINEQTTSLEKSLIQQEHRPFRVVNNLVKYWKNDKKDPKRKASIQAFIWWLISPSTITVASVSIVSIVGLIIAFRANDLLSKQNDKIEKQTELIKVQNERIKEQTYLTESSRRATLIFELTSILDKIDEEIDKVPPDSLTPKLSDRLEGRIIALSLSLRPYRYLQDNGVLTKAMSPERGQLLISLIASKINMSNISLRGDFTRADLKNADLRNTTLDNIRLGESDLSSSELNNSSFSNADIKNAILTKAEIEEVNFSKADISFTNLDLCTGDRVNFYNCLLERSVLDSTSTFASYFKDIKASFLSIKAGRFLECDFSNAVMPFSNLSGSNFYGSNFTDANLRNSTLKKANFTNVIFKNVKLDSAIVDSKNWIDSLSINSVDKQSLKEKYEVKSINNQFVVLIK